MSLLPSHRQPRSMFPDLAQLFSDWPQFGLRPIFGSHLIKVEDVVKEGRYTVRAELPGVDPAKDVEVTVHDGVLTIKAERTEQKEEQSRSEFSYGSFVRSVSLPAEANEDDITATYDKGILTVSVALNEEPTPAERRIEVKSAGAE